MHKITSSPQNASSKRKISSDESSGPVQRKELMKEHSRADIAKDPEPRYFAASAMSAESHEVSATSNHKGVAESSQSGKITETTLTDLVPPSKVQTALNIKLFEATKNGQAKEVQEALDLGADLNAIDGNGRTALHIAILNESEGIAEILFLKMLNSDKEIATFNSIDHEGNTPLLSAIIGGYEDMAKQMILIMMKSDKGIEAINSISSDGFTPLMSAIVSGYKNIAEQLLTEMLESDKGIEAINSRDYEGNTALNLAINKGFVDIVKMLSN